MHRLEIALATCAEWPEMTPESKMLMEEIRRLGVEVRPFVWDDPSVDWSLPEVCVIRETWDYHLKRDDFLSWAEQVAKRTTLFNTPDVIRWNTHKGYLRELENQGVPIVPTEWLDAGSRADLPHIMSNNAWDEVVIKPTVSANAFETVQIRGEQVAEGQAHIDRLLPLRDMMVQPYIASVRDYGERSLIFVDNEFTHAVRRQPALHLEEGSSTWAVAPVKPTEEESALAITALKAAGFPTLYARVDIVRDQHGKTRLMELELVEPSLFLAQAPHAAQRLARAITRPVASSK
jgi:glutathione synthase/RimK-type ligase-like ATP-grasp enzyme